MASAALTPASAALILCLAGCAASHEHELIGRARAPISPAAVQLYLERPARDFEQIAVLNASSEHSFSFSSQGKADVVIRRLKDEAAKLGANGVLLQEIGYASNGSFGTSLGSEHEGPRGTVDLGFGASTLMLQRYGRAIAIYLEPGAAAGDRAAGDVAAGDVADGDAPAGDPGAGGGAAAGRADYAVPGP